MANKDGTAWTVFNGEIYNRPELTHDVENRGRIWTRRDAEGYPNVIAEAMACGRTVVATDASDVPCLIEDGKIGFVIRREDDFTSQNDFAISSITPISAAV